MVEKVIRSRSYQTYFYVKTDKFSGKREKKPRNTFVHTMKLFFLNYEEISSLAAKKLQRRNSFPFFENLHRRRKKLNFRSLWQDISKIFLSTVFYILPVKNKTNSSSKFSISSHTLKYVINFVSIKYFK